MLKAGEDELGSCEGDILKLVIVVLTFRPRGMMHWKAGILNVT